MENKWIKTSRQLPPSGVEVLTWRRKRGFSVGYWLNHKDCAPGRYWVIDGASGGIGTEFEIKPPTHWTALPSPP